MSGGVIFALRQRQFQQLLPWIAFSVQFAAEETSAPAPRTVLHAAIASAPPITSNVITLRTMVELLI
jgi:hypothetical protein